jgi:hypothetical protein
VLSLTRAWKGSDMENDERNLMKLNVFFFSVALPAHSGPWPLIPFPNIFFSQTVISSSQGPYLNTGQYKQNKRIHTLNIHALSGIRTHDPSVRAKTVHALDRAATATG